MKTKGIKISEEFRKFFEILVKSEKGINYDELIKNEWLKEIFEKKFNLIMKSHLYNFNLESALDLKNEIKLKSKRSLIEDVFKHLEKENSEKKIIKEQCNSRNKTKMIASTIERKDFEKKNRKRSFREGNFIKR